MPTHGYRSPVKARKALTSTAALIFLLQGCGGSDKSSAENYYLYDEVGPYGVSQRTLDEMGPEYAFFEKAFVNDYAAKQGDLQREILKEDLESIRSGEWGFAENRIVKRIQEQLAVSEAEAEAILVSLHKTERILDDLHYILFLDRWRKASNLIEQEETWARREAAKEAFIELWHDAGFPWGSVLIALQCRASFSGEEISSIVKKRESNNRTPLRKLSYTIANFSAPRGVSSGADQNPRPCFQMELVANALEKVAMNGETVEIPEEDIPVFSGGAQWTFPPQSIENSEMRYCGPRPTRLVFANGMNTSFASAVAQWFDMRRILSKKLYEQSATPYALNLSWQLALENGPNIAYNQDESILDELLEANSQKLLECLTSSEVCPILNSLFVLLNNSPEAQSEAIARWKRSDEDYQLQHNFYANLLNSFKDWNLLVISHSQGHLYTNEVLRSLKAIYGDATCDRIRHLAVGGAAAITICGEDNIVLQSDKITGPQGLMSGIYPARPTQIVEGDRVLLSFSSHSLVDDYLNEDGALSFVTDKVLKSFKSSIVTSVDNPTTLVEGLPNSSFTTFRDWFSMVDDSLVPLLTHAAAMNRFSPFYEREEYPIVWPTLTHELVMALAGAKKISRGPCNDRSLSKLTQCFALGRAAADVQYDISVSYSRNNTDEVSNELKERRDDATKEVNRNCPPWTTRLHDRPFADLSLTPSPSVPFLMFEPEHQYFRTWDDFPLLVYDWAYHYEGDRQSSLRPSELFDYASTLQSSPSSPWTPLNSIFELP